MTALAVIAPALPTVAVLAGPPGLAMDVVRVLLASAGIAIAEPEGGGGPAANVVILVEPFAEHWPSAPRDDLPIVLVHLEPLGDAELVNAVLAGADAVMSFDSSRADVLAALDQVGRGGSLLAPAHIRAVVCLARVAASSPSVALSRREEEIIASIARGESVKQTARGLGIAPKTVENLQARLFRKLEVRNRAQAVSRAHALHLL